MYRLLSRGVTVKCSCWLVTARCPVRGLRVHRSLSSTHTRCDLSSVLCCQTRAQSTTDKKFHCSICKKAFRLEMAAKLHLQQAHGGDGTVEAGAGPGVESLPAAPNGDVAAPPSNPIEKRFSEDEERRPRRMRPTPKPLHEPDRGVPDEIMGELLGMWDTVGLSRLEGNFVHSTMVMKVFAARPDVSEQPLYEPLTPQGENPFESLSQAPLSVESQRYVSDYALTVDDLSGPFAAAPDQTLNPYRAGKVENPFAKRTEVVREVTRPVQPQAQQLKEEPATAPVTPFGQLPMFGKQLEAKTSSTPASPAEHAPTNPNEVSSPFTAAVTHSPFAGQVASPFTPTQEAAESPFGASPFASASPFVVPGAQDPSPFAASFATSPFATGMMPSQPAAGTIPSAFPGAQQEQRPPEPEHKCATCGKTFSTFEGIAMHSKAKHNVVLERPKDANKKTKRSVPDLPAYVPSPVDLSSTSPFGMTNTCSASWTETEIVPHAQCVSNITIVGRVLDVTTAGEDISHVTVFVEGEQSGEEETVMLCCFGDVSTLVRNTLKRNAVVFVNGTLRLHPVYEASNNKYYVSPVVHVALPTGTLCVIT